MRLLMLEPELPEYELEVWLSSENRRTCASQMSLQASILSLTVWMDSSTILSHIARMAAIVFVPSAPEVTSDSRDAWNERVPSAKCMSIGISRIFFWREFVRLSSIEPISYCTLPMMARH